MKKGLQSFLIIVVLFLGTTVHSKTASDIFDTVSSSVVVIRTYDAKGNDQGLGSGVVLASDVIATNCHVIKDVAKIQVVYKGKQYLATLQYTDWDRDVCTLTVSGINAPAVVKGSTSRLKVGTRVYAIGAPRGLELTLSEGIISSLREVDGGQYLQISAPISPGSSGGGLFDEEGQLIGLPTFYVAEGQQLNFAVPVEWITELPERHKKMSDVAQTPYIEWINKSLALIEKKDLMGLITHSLRWTEAQPQKPIAWFILGSAYGESGQFTEAIKAIEQGLSINAKEANAWFILGNAYSESGQYTEAINSYKQALSINPEYVEAWHNLGVVYNISGQTSQVIEVYKVLKTLDSTMADNFFNKYVLP